MRPPLREDAGRLLLVFPLISAVTISGLPASFVVGQSAQLAASAILADGTKLDATATASWQSSATTVAIVSATGLLTVTGIGDADVTAMLQGVHGSAHVSVPKPVAGPTLVDLEGVVHESAPTEGVVVSGATVGIHYVGCPVCPHDNEETVTDANGRFRLPGIAAPGFALVVSKPGYDAVSYGIVDLPRDEHPSIAVTPSPRVVDEFFSGDCRSNSASGSVITRFATHHDGVLVRGRYFGPTWEALGNRLEYRRATGAAEPFADFFQDVSVRGGFFYEIRVSWLYPCDRGPFTVEFSHPS